MDSVSWLAVGGLGAGLAFLLPFWQRIVGFVKSLQFIIFKEASVTWQIAETVRTYLHHKHGASWLATKSYRQDTDYIKVLGREEGYAQRLKELEVQRVWFGVGRYVRFTDTSMSTIRGTVDLEKLIADAYKWRHALHGDKGVNRYKVCRVGGRYRAASAKTKDRQPLRNATGSEDEEKSEARVTEEDDRRSGWTPWQKALREPVGYTWEEVEYPSRNDMETLALSEEHESLIEEIQFLLDHRPWFEERSLPWRRGYLFHGSPGTGKTMLVRALGQHFRLPIYLFDLASLSNDQLMEAWRDIRSEQPLIAVFEDIDAIYDGRTNVVREMSFFGAGVTFDTFLGILDGVDLQDGIITVVTTNRPESLDKALARVHEDGTTTVRPGRIDRAVPFGPPDEVGRRKIVSRVLLNVDPDLISDVVDSTDGRSGAEVQEAATLAALGEFWRQAPARLIGDPRRTANVSAGDWGEPVQALASNQGEDR